MTTAISLVLLKMFLFFVGCCLLVYSGFLAARHKDKRFMFATVLGVLCLWACNQLKEPIQKKLDDYKKEEIIERLENKPSGDFVPCKIKHAFTIEECLGISTYHYNGEVIGSAPMRQYKMGEHVQGKGTYLGTMKPTNAKPE